MKCHFRWGEEGHYGIQQNIAWSLQKKSVGIGKWFALVGCVGATISYSLGEIPSL